MTTMKNEKNNNETKAVEIAQALSISNNSGYLVVVCYTDPIAIDLENETVLPMVHAYHGLYKTSFVGNGIRSLVYWFRSVKNANRFVKDFNSKGKLPATWIAEHFEMDIYNGKEYDSYGYGLLSENVLL